MQKGEVQRLLHWAGRLQVAHPHHHPHHHHHHHDHHHRDCQVCEAVQDVELCGRRQKCGFLHCNQDKAQVTRKFKLAFEYHNRIMIILSKSIIISLLQSCALRVRWRSEVQEERGGRPQVRQEEKGLGLAPTLQHGTLILQCSHVGLDELPSRVRRPNRNCSLKPLQWCQIRLPEEEIEAPDSMSLNHNKRSRPPGCQKDGILVVCSKIGTMPGCCRDCEHNNSWCSLLAWSPSTWCLYLVPPGTARFYQAPTRCLPGTSTWSTSTWPHPRGCRTIAVASLSVSIRRPPRVNSSDQGGELGRRQARDPKFEVLGFLRSLDSKTNEISSPAELCFLRLLFSETKILFYIMPIGYFDV